jgi:iron complex outermembrane receptor protein
LSQETLPAVFTINPYSAVGGKGDKMKIIGLLSLICVLTAGTFAQNTGRIEGKVVQNSGVVPGFISDPATTIRNRVVTLLSKPDNKRIGETTTDDNGNFAFASVPPGDYEMLVHCDYCLRIVVRKEVSVAAGQTVNTEIELQRAGIAETVTVSADSRQSIEAVSKTVDVITGQEMRDRADFSLAETLRTIPGFRVQQLGGFGRTATIKTRGLRNQDTALLIDGIRFRDPSAITGDASPFLSDFTLTSVSKIEVLRGSGSSLYGTNAIGGVIDFQTPKPQSGWHGQISGAFGGLGLARFRGNISKGTSDDKFGFNVGISRTNYFEGIDGDDDADNTNFQGRIEYNPFKKTNISARLFVSDAFAKLNSSPDTIGTLPAPSTIINAIPLSIAELNRYANGTPIDQLNAGNANFIPDTNDPDNFQKSKFFTGQLALNQVINDKLFVQAFYQGLMTKRQNTNGVLGIGFQPFDGDENYFFNGQIHTGGGSINWNPLKNNQVKAGYELEWEKFGNDGVFATPTDDFSIRARQSSNTLYVQDLLGLLGDRLQLSGAFRAQWFSLESPTFSSPSLPNRFANAETPPASYTGDASASYYFEKTGTKVRAHVGNGYRVPSLYERFSFSYFFGTYFFSGNPALKPERSTAFDGGVEQTLANGRVRLSGTWFYTEIRDEIAYLPTDDFNAPAYYNFDRHFSRGAEFGATVKPSRSTDIFASYTFTNSDVRNFRRVMLMPPGTLTSRDTRSYGIPDHQFTLVATQRFKRFWVNLDFLGTSSYLAPIFSNTTFNSYIYRFKGARKADLTAGYTFPFRKDKMNLRLFGTIENLGGYDYYENGFRTVGRTGRVGLAFGF